MILFGRFRRSESGYPFQFFFVVPERNNKKGFALHKR